MISFKPEACEGILEHHPEYKLCSKLIVNFFLIGMINRISDEISSLKILMKNQWNL